MIVIINIVLPIFLLIFSGYLLSSFKFVSKEMPHHLVSFIFWASAPALIFSSISNYHISELFEWRFWIAYLISIFCIVVFAYYLFYKFFFHEKMLAIAVAFSITFKNTIMMGFPILMEILGKKATISMAATVIIFNCIIGPILVFVFEITILAKEFTSTKNILFSATHSVLKNPLVAAAFFGVVFSIFHIHIPNSLNKMFSYLGNAFTPCALFSVGVQLSSFRFSGKFLNIFIIILLSLFICPVVALILSCVFQLTPFYAISLIIFSAMPTAQSVYIYVSKYLVFKEEVATIISLTTACSIFTIPIFIYISYRLWPIMFHLHFLF